MTAAFDAGAFDSGAFETASAPSLQTLTQNTRFDNSNSFFAATVTRGAVALTPVRFNNVNTFYAHTVTSVRTLTAARFDNGQTFYAPTVAVAATVLVPALFTNNNVVYAATVGRGPVTLTAGLFTNNNTFYDAVVTKGAVNLQPVLYSNTNVFYNATLVNAGVNLLPALYTNNNAFYTPVVTTTITLSANRYTQNNTFYNINVVQNIKFPDWVESGHVEEGWVSWPAFNAPKFFSATVTTGEVFVTPQRFDNTSEFYASEIELGDAILVASLVTNNTVFFVHNVINEYPDPKYVLKGIMYGPGLVGTYQEGIKVELSTGQLVKPLNSKVAIFL